MIATAIFSLIFLVIGLILGIVLGYLLGSGTQITPPNIPKPKLPLFKKKVTENYTGAVPRLKPSELERRKEAIGLSEYQNQDE